LIKPVPIDPAPGSREYFDYLMVDNDSRRVYVTSARADRQSDQTNTRHV
jgi:hypothetical protein